MTHERENIILREALAKIGGFAHSYKKECDKNIMGMSAIDVADKLNAIETTALAALRESGHTGGNT